MTDNPYDAHLMKFGNGHLIDNRFEIISNPVRRSFGVSYLSFDRQTQTKRVLLFIPDSITNDSEAMTTIREEAALIRWLDHPHIAKLYDFHSGARYHYFELEYVPGKNLRQKKMVAAEKRLSENIVKWLGIQVLDALEYAHNNNILHRNLNPQNIVLTADGKVKLIDFGISETLRASVSLVWNTIPQTTVLYMSPEQLQGKQISIASDLYSLAATMYDLLNGKPPFFSGDVYHQIIEEPVQPIAEVTPELNAIILRALSKDPSQRFQTCAGMREPLQQTVVKPAEPKFRETPPEPVRGKVRIRETRPKESPPPFRFRFFSLNPTLKFMAIGLVIVFMTYFIQSHLKRFTQIKSAVDSVRTIEARQDTFRLKMARALVQQADTKFRMNYYVQPRGNNALELYGKALQAHPGDSAALNGIEKIKQFYRDQILSARKNGQFKAAESILADALTYFKDDSLLLSLADDSVGSLKIRILNGAGIKGIAKVMATNLTQLGYHVSESANFVENGKINWNVPTTILTGPKSHETFLKKLSDKLNIPYKWSNSDQGDANTVSLILGQDYQQMAIYKRRR